MPMLDYHASFSMRESVETDMGGTRDEWVLQFVEWAGVKHLRGGESVMQARLAPPRCKPALVSPRPAFPGTRSPRSGAGLP